MDVNEVERAIAEIGDIRAKLAASTRFRGYAPEALVVVAAISLLVAVAQTLWPASLAYDNASQIVVWAVVLLGSFASVALEAAARSRRQHGEMGPAMLRGALSIIVPVVFTAVALGAGIALFSPAALWIVPAIWLFLIAIAVFSSRQTLPPAIIWAAAWYLASGTALIVLAGPEGRLTPWMMGVPMTVGHLLVAWTLRSESRTPRHG
jgi:hypothetical protein